MGFFELTDRAWINHLVERLISLSAVEEMFTDVVRSDST